MINDKTADTKTNKEYKLYHIKWKDARSQKEWGDGKIDLAEIEDVGWIINEDKEKTVICCQIATDIIDDPEPFGMLTVIPTSCIYSKKQIKLSS